MSRTRAEQIADKILANLCDRSGIGDAIEGCDEDIQAEIRETIADIIEQGSTE